MASGWAKARAKVGSKDLDAEFEKFLNESLSDESLSSPRRSITPHGARSKSKILVSQSKNDFEKPWWATSEDEENSTQVKAAKDKWFKKNKDETDTPVLRQQQNTPDNPLALSRDSLDVSPSRPGTALDTILSEPEDSSHGDSKKENKITAHSKNDESSHEKRSESIATVDEPDGTTTTHETSQPAGFDTLEEIKDKEAFFSSIEKEKGGSVDYEELNKKFDENSNSPVSSPVLASPEGIAVEGLTPYRPPHYDDDSDEGSDSKSDEVLQNVTPPLELPKTMDNNMDDHTENDTLEERTEDVDTVKANDVSVNKNEHKPSLLSKVGLMESLDSTGGLNLAEKLAKLQMIREGATNTPNVSDSIPSSTTGVQLATGQTTAELANALQQVNGLSTQSLARDSKTNENIEVLNDVTSKPAVQSGMLFLDKDQNHDVKTDVFSLQPVISNFAKEPKIASSSTLIGDHTLPSEYETQSLLGHLHLFNPSHVERSEPNSFSRKPEEGKGFSLQAINANETDEDSPPTESLRSIKSIAEERKKKILAKTQSLQENLKQVSKELVRGAAKTKSEHKKRSNIPTRRKGTSKSNTNVKKAVLNTSPAKPPVRPNVTKKWKPKTKTSSPLQKTPSKEKHLENNELENNELIASLESFATYLKEFSHSGGERAHESSHTVNRETHLSSLDREQSLQREVRQLRLAYEDERRRNERQYEEMSSREKAWQMEREQLCSEYDARLESLHQDVFVLKKKLEIQAQEVEERKTSESFKNMTAKELSKEDFESIQKQLEQQEALLNGYQQENERLYTDLKRRDLEKKKFESKMFKENRKQASEIANLKEQLESRSNIESNKGSASLGAARITQLDNQVKFYQKRETEYKEEIITLENEVSSLKRMLSLNEKQKNEQSTHQGLLQQIEGLKVNHHTEVSKLQKRLNWYADNQQLLDRDLAELKDKRDEIKELRILVDRLENEVKSLRKEKSDRKGEKNSDAKKILDLQRQVKEMEEIIRRRYPNSIPAMIFAASATPGETKSYKVNEPEKPSLSNVFLEKRIKTLEDELEEKDTDNAKKIRAIEQRYSAMSMRYEEHVKQLDGKIVELMSRLKSEKSVEILEEELSRQKIDYDDLLQSQKTELTKRAKISELKLEIAELRGKQKLSSKRTSKPYPVLQKEISKLRENLRLKGEEISELHTTVLFLQQEREKIVSEQSSRQLETRYITDQKLKLQKHLTDQTTSPLVAQDEENKKLASFEKENKNLRNAMEELRIRCEEKRLKYEALEAKTMHDNRRLHEEYEEQAKLVEESHKMELEKLKMNFIVEHSNSKVAELSGKIKSYELMVEHLKESLEEAKEDRESLSVAKKKEETLREDISHLQDELAEARKHYTPAMHHYKLLEAKIQNMETRYTNREKELQSLIERTRHKATVDRDIVEDKWRDILRNKDREVQHFREELDSIIEVLEELQRQGVILPNHRINTQI